MKIALFGFATFALLAGAPPIASAQPYPNRPIRAVVPLAPGGGTDTVGRLVFAKLGELLGQQIVVDNRGGGGGVIGTDLVAKATADGYTLLMGSITTNAVNPVLYKKLPYDHIRDFAPISMVGTVPNVLVVHASVPAKSVKEFIAYAKANPGKISYGSAGIGSAPHLSMELIKSMGGINMVHIPYKGSGPALADVLGGQLQALCSSLAGLLPHIKAGRVRALGVTTTTRNPQLPDVPTIAEAGIPGYEVVIWYALFAPARTPPAILARLNAETVKALNSADLKERLTLQGLDVGSSTQDQLMAFVKSETVKWAKVAKDSGAQLE
ncbi:MAG: tripartite tricarboxylate transporter substrate binding protein [Burkholderiales bacterium]